jgi:hypothetical protein
MSLDYRPMLLSRQLFRETVPLNLFRFFWKIIYDNSTNSGVAAIGINNPYLQVWRLYLNPNILYSSQLTIHVV